MARAYLVAGDSVLVLEQLEKEFRLLRLQAKAPGLGFEPRDRVAIDMGIIEVGEGGEHVAVLGVEADAGHARGDERLALWIGNEVLGKGVDRAVVRDDLDLTLEFDNEVANPTTIPHPSASSASPCLHTDP